MFFVFLLFFWHLYLRVISVVLLLDYICSAYYQKPESTDHKKPSVVGDDVRGSSRTSTIKGRLAVTGITGIEDVEEALGGCGRLFIAESEGDRAMMWLSGWEKGISIDRRCTIHQTHIHGHDLTKTARCQ